MHFRTEQPCESGTTPHAHAAPALRFETPRNHSGTVAPAVLRLQLGALFVTPFSASMDGIGKAQSAAIGGLNRAGEMMNRAVSQVARAPVTSSAAKVSISSEARTLAQAGDTATRDSFEEPLVGAQVAKHLATANVKVLQTTDETLAELSKIKR